MVDVVGQPSGRNRARCERRTHWRANRQWHLHVRRPGDGRSISDSRRGIRDGISHRHSGISTQRCRRGRFPRDRKPGGVLFQFGARRGVRRDRALCVVCRVRRTAAGSELRQFSSRLKGGSDTARHLQLRVEGHRFLGPFSRNGRCVAVGHHRTRSTIQSAVGCVAGSYAGGRVLPVAPVGRVRRGGALHVGCHCRLTPPRRLTRRQRKHPGCPIDGRHLCVHGHGDRLRAARTELHFDRGIHHRAAAGPARGDDIVGSCGQGGSAVSDPVHRFGWRSALHVVARIGQPSERSRVLG